MSGIIECKTCKSMSAHPQKTTKSQIISWSSPDGYEDRFFVEYACANCQSEFAKVIPGHEHLDSSINNLGMGSTGGGYGFIYDSPSNSTRGIGFRGKVKYSAGHVYNSGHIYDTEAAYIARNRRRKTAGIEDIKSRSRVVIECKEYSITQIDLKLEEDD